MSGTTADRTVDPNYAHEPALRELEETLRGSGVEHEVRHYTSDDLASTDVVHAAEESGAELIVIGLRRRTPVGKLIMGSDAQRILLEADCPVLAVKV